MQQYSKRMHVHQPPKGCVWVRSMSLADGTFVADNVAIATHQMSKQGSITMDMKVAARAVWVSSRVQLTSQAHAADSQASPPHAPRAGNSACIQSPDRTLGH